jgi:membrane protease subunit (stomatin/prohibitin family)
VDASQAAERTRVLLEEWKGSCLQSREPDLASMSWSQQLQHQISHQQAEALLSKVTSLKYGR